MKRRIDSSDPRRPGLARPYKLPGHWTSGEPDIIGGLLGSATWVLESCCSESRV